MWFPVRPVVTRGLIRQADGQPGHECRLTDQSPDFADGQAEQNTYRLCCVVSVNIMGFCRLDFSMASKHNREESAKLLWLHSFCHSTAVWEKDTESAFFRDWSYCCTSKGSSFGDLSPALNCLVCTDLLLKEMLVQFWSGPTAFPQWTPSHGSGVGTGRELFLTGVWMRSPCFGGRENLIAWPWSENSRWLMSQKTVTFNKLPLV